MVWEPDGKRVFGIPGDPMDFSPSASSARPPLCCPWTYGARRISPRLESAQPWSARLCHMLHPWRKERLRRGSGSSSQQLSR